MHRPRALLAALVVLCSLIVGVAIAEAAFTTRDITGIKLDETFSKFGTSGYHIQSGTDGSIAFRWLDAPTKDTTIRAMNCDGTFEYGRVSFDAGDTTYGVMSGPPLSASTCFQLQGRTQAGEGQMGAGHDGRVRY